jgi:hypothetical protein
MFSSYQKTFFTGFRLSLGDDQLAYQMISVPIHIFSLVPA